MNDLEERYKKDLEEAEQYIKDQCAKWPENTTFQAMQRAKAYDRRNKVKADYQRKLKGWSKIVPLLKKAGLPIASSRTTAIRGHKDKSLGFKVNSDTDGVRIYFQSQAYEALGTYRKLSIQQKK